MSRLPGLTQASPSVLQEQTKQNYPVSKEDKEKLVSEIYRKLAPFLGQGKNLELELRLCCFNVSIPPSNGGASARPLMLLPPRYTTKKVSAGVSKSDFYLMLDHLKTKFPNCEEETLTEDVFGRDGLRYTFAIDVIDGVEKRRAVGVTRKRRRADYDIMLTSGPYDWRLSLSVENDQDNGELPSIQDSILQVDGGLPANLVGAYARRKRRWSFLDGMCRYDLTGVSSSAQHPEAYEVEVEACCAAPSSEKTADTRISSPSDSTVSALSKSTVLDLLDRMDAITSVGGVEGVPLRHNVPKAHAGMKRPVY